MLNWTLIDLHKKKVWYIEKNKQIEKELNIKMKWTFYVKELYMNRYLCNHSPYYYSFFLEEKRMIFLKQQKNQYRQSGWLCTRWSEIAQHFKYINKIFPTNDNINELSITSLNLFIHHLVHFSAKSLKFIK